MATNFLDRRRRELGMPIRALAVRSGVSQSTVKRILNGGLDNVAFGTVRAVAEALGMNIRFDGVDAETYQHQQAERKAERIVRRVQGTSALEAQAVPEKALTRMIRRTVAELVAGSTHRLWAD